MAVLEATCVEGIVGTMEARYGLSRPKSELRKWVRQIADAQDWQAVREGVVEAKHCVGSDGAETFVLVRRFSGVWDPGEASRRREIMEDLAGGLG